MVVTSKCYSVLHTTKNNTTISYNWSKVVRLFIKLKLFLVSASIRGLHSIPKRPKCQSNKKFGVLKSFYSYKKTLFSKTDQDLDKDTECVWYKRRVDVTDWTWVKQMLQEKLYNKTVGHSGQESRAFHRSTTRHQGRTSAAVVGIVVGVFIHATVFCTLIARHSVRFLVLFTTQHPTNSQSLLHEPDYNWLKHHTLHGVCGPHQLLWVDSLSHSSHFQRVSSSVYVPANTV